ncbi:hypothetical protein chiPu_0017627 [Chiloscyllium punctatum]|uniref:Uncharacterized protein n=1 Tax=Chiloscyllium punctatum TaxID=137246 RepID=A0A401RHL8_CHIPU|nr:hypothetical protein [Chiloscyllium punctatum]
MSCANLKPEEKLLGSRLQQTNTCRVFTHRNLQPKITEESDRIGGIIRHWISLAIEFISKYYQSCYL